MDNNIWIEAGLINSTGLLIDNQAAKVFTSPADMHSHPIATYMARLAPRTRRGLVTYLKIARDILSDKHVSLADFPWAKLEYKHMVLLRRTLLDRYRWESVNHTLTFVRGVLKECWRLDLMPYEQYIRAAGIESAKGLREIKGRFIRPHELNDVFALCAADNRPHGTRDAAILSLFYCTGLRRSEAQRLDLSDYDPTTGEIVVQKDKLNRRRTTYIANEGKAAL